RRPRPRPRWQQRSTRLVAGNPSGGTGLPGRFPRRLGPVDQFLPIVDMPSGVQFSFFGSFEVGTEHFPIAAIPLQEIVSKAEAGEYSAKPARVFRFEEIAEAHRVMESSDALGKLVIEVA